MHQTTRIELVFTISLTCYRNLLRSIRRFAETRPD
jgi:hypothetical protein